MIRLERALRGDIQESRRYQIHSIDGCWRAMKRCAARICGPADKTGRAFAALATFTERLYTTQGIDGVAFLRTKEEHCADLLSIEVVMALAPGDDASEMASTAVRQAELELSRVFAGYMPNSIDFVNSAGLDFRSLEQKLWGRWKSDDESRLAAFLIFDPIRVA